MGFESLHDNVDVSTASSSGTLEGVGGTTCCASREVELENKVVELSYQVDKLTEDKKELEKNLAESEDFGLNLSSLTAELEGSHRRLSLSLSTSINKGELLFEEAMQVKEVEESLAQKVECLTRDLRSKEKDVMKMEDLVTSLTKEVALCKDKEEQLENKLGEARKKGLSLMQDIELKNEQIKREIIARERAEQMLEKTLKDIEVLELKLSEKEEEVKNMSVKRSRGSSQRSSLDDPLVHDVSVDDKVFEENLKGQRSPACMFTPSKIPIYSPISAIRRGPSASSTPNSSKERLGSIADEIKESDKTDNYSTSLTDLCGSESKKEVRIFSMAPKVSGVSEVTYNLICLFLGEGLTFLLYKGEPKPEIVV